MEFFTTPRLGINLTTLFREVIPNCILRTDSGNRQKVLHRKRARQGTEHTVFAPARAASGPPFKAPAPFRAPTPPDPHLHFLTRRPPPLLSAHKLPFLVFLPCIVNPVPYPVLAQCRTMPYHRHWWVL